MPMPLRRTGYSPDRARDIWQSRTDLVKQQAAAATAAADANTARLRALRLAKQAEDAEATRVAQSAAPIPKGRAKGGR